MIFAGYSMLLVQKSQCIFILVPVFRGHIRIFKMRSLSKIKSKFQKKVKGFLFLSDTLYERIEKNEIGGDYL